MAIKIRQQVGKFAPATLLPGCLLNESVKEPLPKTQERRAIKRDIHEHLAHLIGLQIAKAGKIMSQRDFTTQQKRTKEPLPKTGKRRANPKNPPCPTFNQRAKHLAP